MRRLFFFAVITVAVLGPISGPTLAANPATNPGTLGTLISDLYNFSLSIVGLCVFFMFLYAGVQILITGNVGLAKKIAQDAVIGTVLLYSAYIILNSINHDLVSQSDRTTATQ
jgi:hypothetical protein